MKALGDLPMPTSSTFPSTAEKTPASLIEKRDSTSPSPAPLRRRPPCRLLRQRPVQDMIHVSAVMILRRRRGDADVISISTGIEHDDTGTRTSTPRSRGPRRLNDASTTVTSSFRRASRRGGRKCRRRDQHLPTANVCVTAYKSTTIGDGARADRSTDRSGTTTELPAASVRARGFLQTRRCRTTSAVPSAPRPGAAGRGVQICRNASPSGVGLRSGSSTARSTADVGEAGARSLRSMRER